MHPTRRRALAVPGLAAALLLVASASGCYHNPLPDYAPRIRSMTVRLAVPSRPYVYVGTSVHHSGILGAAEMVATGAAIGVTAGVRKTLLQAVPAARIQKTLETALHGPMAGQLPFPIARGPGDRPTASLQITVTSYGIDAGDAGADAVYTFDTTARLVYLPEAKILWEDGTTARVPVSWSPSGSAEVPSVNEMTDTAANLAILSSATPKRFQAVFDALTRDAVHLLARDLNRASARH